MNDYLNSLERYDDISEDHWYYRNDIRSVAKLFFNPSEDIASRIRYNNSVIIQLKYWEDEDFVFIDSSFADHMNPFTVVMELKRIGYRNPDSFYGRNSISL